jgi:hypothetical protein
MSRRDFLAAEVAALGPRKAAESAGRSAGRAAN